jgi:rfaE bifunctional protein nucleotidyltransferase chain/domain
MPLAAPILEASDLSAWRESQRHQGLRLVLTNGCFDLLHAGHVQYLQAARACGDALLVAINSDDSIRQLKGPDRPINHESDRAHVLAGLRCVDAVTVFTSVRAVDVIRQVQPEVYVKGGDYTLETLDPDERAALQACQAEIKLVGFLPGRSSTALIQALQGKGC